MPGGAGRMRGMWPQDWPAVARIYRDGQQQGTFESTVPDWQTFSAARPEPLRLVAVDPDGTVLGWVAASPVSARPVYAGVVEHSVYVDPAQRGRGVGRLLLEAFVACAEVHGVWSIRSGIFPENTASLALHARCGFREVGRFDRPGRRDGVWRDVVLVERRSAVVGTEEPLIRSALPGELPGELPGRQPWRSWVVDAEVTGGVLLGRAGLDRVGTPGQPAYLLRELLVEPAQRGLGLGRRLLAAVLAAAELDAPGPALVGLPARAGDGPAYRLGFAPARPDARLPVELRPGGPGGVGYVRTVGG